MTQSIWPLFLGSGVLFLSWYQLNLMSSDATRGPHMMGGEAELQRSSVSSQESQPSHDTALEQESSVHSSSLFTRPPLEDRFVSLILNESSTTVFFSWPAVSIFIVYKNFVKILDCWELFLCSKSIIYLRKMSKYLKITLLVIKVMNGWSMSALYQLVHL